MEKITKEILIEFISKNDIELIATHNNLCIPIINRIYKKMCAGIQFFEIKVDGDLICDGHHRYLASLLAKFPLERMPGRITSATMPFHWQSVGFDENDWDTPEKIDILNERDANYNNMTIAEIIALLE